MTKIETLYSDASIFIERAAAPRELLLRIGEGKSGKPRYAHLSISQARVVAYTLLAEAERIGASDESEGR